MVSTDGSMDGIPKAMELAESHKHSQKLRNINKLGNTLSEQQGDVSKKVNKGQKASPKKEDILSRRKEKKWKSSELTRSRVKA